jgi:hypothetical protein
MSEPVYTFNFTSNFEESVYNQCLLPDPLGNRREIVEEKANSMFNVLSLSFFKVNQMKSVISYNGDFYQILCKK